MCDDFIELHSSSWHCKKPRLGNCTWKLGLPLNGHTNDIQCTIEPSHVDWTNKKLNARVAHGGWVPRNLELELLTPNPGSQSTPKACPSRNPATSSACHTKRQPNHLSHAKNSKEKIMIMIIQIHKNENNKTTTK